MVIDNLFVAAICFFVQAGAGSTSFTTAAIV